MLIRPPPPSFFIEMFHKLKLQICYAMFIMKKKNVRIFYDLYYMFYTKYSFYYKNVCSLLQIQILFIDNL